MIQLSRRSLIKGMVATAAGLLLPAEVLAEPDHRVWALDRTQLGRGARASLITSDEPAFTPMHDWAELLEPINTPFTTLLRGDNSFNYVQRFDYRIQSNGKRFWVTDVHPDGSLTIMRWGTDNLPTTPTIAPGDADRIREVVTTAQATTDWTDTRRR